MSIELIHITPDAEKLIAFCARVSSNNQSNPEYSNLIKYCVRQNHWSILEMASMCVEITTSKSIANQILRHRSFHFQEFSQRYAKAQGFININPRRQDYKNRQNSFDDLTESDKKWYSDAQEKVTSLSNQLYNQALDRGIAKESARFLLPLSTETKMYMHGTVRDWVHYINVRTDPSTQLEHREVALQIKEIFIKQLPIIAEALNWSKNNGTSSEN